MYFKCVGFAVQLKLVNRISLKKYAKSSLPLGKERCIKGCSTDHVVTIQATYSTPSSETLKTLTSHMPKPLKLGSLNLNRLFSAQKQLTIYYTYIDIYIPICVLITFIYFRRSGNVKGVGGVKNMVFCKWVRLGSMDSILPTGPNISKRLSYNYNYQCQLYYRYKQQLERKCVFATHPL